MGIADVVYISPMPVRDALMQAVQLIVPTTADLGLMINEALDNVDDRSLLPEAYRRQVIAPDPPPVCREGNGTGATHPTAIVEQINPPGVNNYSRRNPISAVAL